MKKLLFIVLLAVGITSINASNDYALTSKAELGNRNYYQGNFSVNDLPKSIIKYLEQNYSGYSIMICKRKGDGYYYLKISYPGNQYRRFYRNLVFDYNGNVVKG